MKKIISIVLQTIFFSAIAIVCITLLSSRFAVLGLRSYTVVTGSMEPKIHTGSVVFTLPSKTYKVGDVLTFNRGKISITHRIVAIKNGQYQTKGDANKIADPELVDKSNVIGKDILIVPLLGKFTAFLKTIPGFIIFILIPMLIYILLEARVIKKEWEKEVEKRILKKMNSTNFLQLWN